MQQLSRADVSANSALSASNLGTPEIKSPFVVFLFSFCSWHL
jgi:hypothetical protein